jgi:ATP-dependent DNA ligase
MTAAASPARPGQPGWLDPELATLTRDRFSDPAWIFERKLDGERCLAFRCGRGVRLMTRNQKDDTSTYPEITGALAAQQAGDFIIDGEIVAFDGSQTRFARLQQRLGVRHPGPDLLAQVPVWFYIFDVLWAGLEQDRPPFDRGKLPRSGVHWVQPRLVAEVGFSEWTTAGELRHPRFQGLRDDKDPADVVRETPQDTTR